VRSSLWLILALLAGLAIGAALRAFDPGVADSAILIADPVGTLWVNAIRMTVIPLVVSTVLAALLAPGSRALFARLGWRAAALLGVLALVISSVSVVAAQSAFGWISLDDARAAASGLAAADSAAAAPGFREWLVSLIPVNPVKAAADGAMLPLLIFTIAFGLAASKLLEPRRDVIRDLAEAVSEAMLRIVQAVLYLAPLGNERARLRRRFRGGTGGRVQRAVVARGIARHARGCADQAVGAPRPAGLFSADIGFHLSPRQRGGDPRRRGVRGAAVRDRSGSH
jgi:Na+/H+-dicarboxylate symporter